MLETLVFPNQNANNIQDKVLTETNIHNYDLLQSIGTKADQPAGGLTFSCAQTELKIHPVILG